MPQARVTDSSIRLRNLYLGREAVDELGLKTGEKYQVSVLGIESAEIRGTLTNNFSIGALSPLYAAFDLAPGDTITVSVDDGVLLLEPPQEKSKNRESPSEAAAEPAEEREEQTVFGRKRLRHLHIEAFSPGNLGRWVPRTEADVYMVFGPLSEYTDFRYCCGASKALLDQLGYRANTKPDAIVIDRQDSSYLVAEVKMRSSDFALNHQKDDVDVLICWEHDAKDAAVLPPHNVVLRDVLQTAIEAKEIDL